MGKITSTSKEEVSVDTIEKGPLPDASPLSSSSPASPSSPRLETPDEVAMAHPEWRAAEKRLVRKLDMTLMPVIWTLYMFNYLDRNNLCIFYVLSCWYTQKEIAFRTAILYSSMLIATAFSGLIAAAVFAHLDGAHGLAGWQWLFIIEGAGSFASAFAALAFLPDYVGSRTGMCSWLMSERELQVAAQRMDDDRVSVPEEKSCVWRGLGLAVKDARTWAFVCMTAFYLSCHGLNSFFPTIVQGSRLGSNTTTLMLTAPPYLLAAVVALCVAVSSDRRADRGLHIVGTVCVAMLGFVISAATTDRPARYFTSFLYLPGVFASTGLIFSWAASVASETPEKRATATSIAGG
ncbi:major facilitator superfamily transporter [Colletotrichum salicis]|uniref:Major facilitator superfamily transporter n=1 Tax=Colletotrichum salicis TaxID=1209931 RepID=A0A135UYX1_9PEZI|nr:major facilitator superfamily transporter [Colletotrichum salicis]